MIFRANFQFSNIDPTLILQLTSKYLISNNTNITYKISPTTINITKSKL